VKGKNMNTEPSTPDKTDPDGLTRQQRRLFERKTAKALARKASPVTRAAIAKVTLGSAEHAACTRAGVTVYQASTKVGAKVFQPGDCLAIGRHQRRALKSIAGRRG
jgi:hypothetical protein